MSGEVVLFSACVTEIFGSPGGGIGPAEAFRRLSERAGVEVLTPADIEGLCCGTPWQSKGLTRGHDVAARRTLDGLWKASAEGTLPIACDASSCTLGLHELRDHLDPQRQERFDNLTIVDAVTFIRGLLERLPSAHDRLAAIVVHPTCSTEHLGITDDLVAVAEAGARDVVVPIEWGCCGYAGDRGMLRPELTEAATRREAAEVGKREYDAYVSCNRTCELGMQRATRRPYVHVLEVLEHVTRPVGAR